VDRRFALPRARVCVRLARVDHGISGSFNAGALHAAMTATTMPAPRVRLSSSSPLLSAGVSGSRDVDNCQGRARRVPSGASRCTE
jgi:hypothetical protein